MIMSKLKYNGLNLRLRLKMSVLQNGKNRKPRKEERNSLTIRKKEKKKKIRNKVILSLPTLINLK